jgi:hypothetical protein
MKQHEREYFISRIRSGIYTLKVNGLTLKIMQPTIEEEFEINQIFQESYLQALEDDFMTEEQALDFMIDRGLWCEKDNEKIEGLKKDIERLKVEIYNARNNDRLKQEIRAYLRAGEKQFRKQNEKKSMFFTNTCEGIAILEKSFAFLKRCTFLNNALFDFESVSIEDVVNTYYSMILTESTVRELARNEPWRSLWALNASNSFYLFANKNRELSPDQKSLLVWSKMYDNIQESLEAPSEDVINDDDMLDGWFIIQRKKREKQQAESELENTVKNEKIKNSSEIFVMAGSKKDAQRINSMNDIGGKIVKQQRENLIKQKGDVTQNEFQDEKVKLGGQSQQMFKDKFRR